MTIQSNVGPAWFAGFGSLEAEIPSARGLEVRGTLPAELDGTLYRIGPARHDVYGERYRHWFDGDGMVHAIDLRDGRVTYTNRFVATEAKARDDRATRRVTAGFGTRSAGGPIARFRNRNADQNKANTNVVFHGGRLLALWEGGRPYRLDPTTLDTLGEDDLGGVLRPGETFSAHPKYDRATGEMWNFGLEHGRTPLFHVFASAADGTTRRVASVPLPFAPWVHDVALTARYVVAVLGPMVLPRVPLGLMTGQRSFGESLRWRPELGTHVALIERATGAVRWFTTGPMMVVHVANAFDDDGDDVVVDLALYDDAALVQAGFEFMEGVAKTPLRSWPTRLTIKTASGRVERTKLADAAMEFPRVAGRALSTTHTRIYGVGWHEASGADAFIGVPLCVDLAAGGRVTRAPFAAHEFAGECVPVAKRGARDDTDAWLLTLVLDAAAGTTELRVLDGADVAAPPVATVRLPHLVPFGFHGNFVRREALAVPPRAAS